VSEYRLYHLDGAGRVSGGEWIEADDDHAALKLALGRCKAVHCEVWQGQRLVATVPIGEPSYPHS
jgi:hypothetical protein